MSTRSVHTATHVSLFHIGVRKACLLSIQAAGIQGHRKLDTGLLAEGLTSDERRGWLEGV